MTGAALVNGAFLLLDISSFPIEQFLRSAYRVAPNLNRRTSAGVVKRSAASAFQAL